MVDTLLLIMILIYFDIISDSQPCEFSSTSRSPFPVSAAYGMSHAEAHRLADQRGGVGSTGRSLDAAGVLGTFGQGPWAVGTCKRGFRQTHHSARGRRHVPFCEWGYHDWPDEKNLMKNFKYSQSQPHVVRRGSVKRCFQGGFITLVWLLSEFSTPMGQCFEMGWDHQPDLNHGFSIAIRATCDLASETRKWRSWGPPSGTYPPLWLDDISFLKLFIASHSPIEELLKRLGIESYTRSKV